MLWLPALLGWGLPAYLVRRRLDGRPAAGSLDLVEPLAGLALLAACVTAANFFIPVRGLPLPLLALGWLALAARLRLGGLPRITPAQIALGLAVLLLAAFLCRGVIENDDTGLYHSSAIEWMRANIAPLGLSNLHGRLGFTSHWLALAAVIELPFAPDRHTNYFILPALLLWLWGVAACIALGRALRSGRSSLAGWFLALTPIAFFSETLTGNLPSPSPDLAVLLLSFLLAHLGLRAVASNSVRGADWWGLVILAVFLAAIKLSAVPWLLLPALVWWLGRRQATLRSRLMIASVAGAVLLLSLPWLARSVVVSGCLAYPVPFSCLYPLPWAAPPDAALRETVWVLSWARLPNAPMVGVVSSLTWLPAWYARVSAMPDLQILAAVFIIGLALLALTRVVSPAPAPAERRPFLTLSLVCLAGLAYWFVIAPEPRFGAGFLWSGGLLPLAFGLARLASGSRWTGPTPRLLRVSFVSLALALVTLAALSAVLRRAAPILTYQQTVWTLAPLPVPPFTQVKTLSGDILNRPTETDQCWLIPLSCTPFASEELRLVRRADGQVVAIYR